MTFLCHSQVLITVPLRALLDQFAPDFPSFCKVGTGHNKKIDFDAKGFIAVTDSVHLLKKIKFHSVFVDEAHHPLPPKMPQSAELYRFSATHKDEPDFRYTMGQAIEDGVLCDYDITVPALTAHHAYVCLADLLLKQAGRFRRVLAYCNSVAEAKRFRMVLRELGLAAWHINGTTPLKKRQTAIAEFAGPLQKPVHVLVTVEVLGEGINIPNADTCMFVEPRSSYRSIIQAIGRVLRHHPAKTLAHIILPAVAFPSSRSASIPLMDGSRQTTIHQQQQPNAREISNTESPKPEVFSQTGQGRELYNGGPMRPMSSRAKGETDLSPGDKSPAAIRSPVASAHRDAWQKGELRRKQPKDIQAGLLMQNGLGPAGSSSESKCQGIPKAQMGLDGSKSKNVEVEADFVSQSGEPAILGSFRDHGQDEETAHGPVFFDCQRSQQLHRQHPRSASKPMVDVSSLKDTKSRNGITLTAGRRGALRLTASDRSPMFDQHFDSQLERFLATLMMADHRLVGATAGHRIQLDDCTLAEAGVSMMKGWTTEIYNRLSVILLQEDPWQARLRTLEAFAKKHGRLLTAMSAQYSERTLAIWLRNQCFRFKQNKMSMHRFQKLTSSSSLIAKRAQGWLTGDADGLFTEKCQALRKHMQLYGSIPKKRHQHDESPRPSHKLANWLGNLAGTVVLLNPDKIQMLQEVHPLVKALVLEWQSTPPAIDQCQWEQRLRELSKFVSARGRLPKRGFRGSPLSKAETRCYTWLRVERRRLLAGHLPTKLAQQLQNSHSLIAEYFDAALKGYASVAAGEMLERKKSNDCGRDGVAYGDYLEPKQAVPLHAMADVEYVLAWFLLILAFHSFIGPHAFMDRLTPAHHQVTKP